MSTDASQHQGKSFPLGATLSRGGANFSVFAKHNVTVQLLLFDDVDAPTPSRVIDLNPRTNRTYHYWHAFVPGVAEGQVYAYRVPGPFDPERGLRFDPAKVLLDPYGKCVARPTGRSREAARHPGDNAPTALRSVVVDPSTYDWEGDAPLGNYLLLKNIEVSGLQVSDYRKRRPAQVTACYAEIFAFYQHGKLQPDLATRFPLERAGGSSGGTT